MAIFSAEEEGGPGRCDHGRKKKKEEEIVVILLQQTMKKASSHRKRHIPPGPVGIWFQSHQQLKSNKQRNSDGATLNDDGNQKHQHSTQDSFGSDKQTVNNLSFSPVWTSVQQSLQIITPYLPTWNNDPAQRYKWLRPHLPSVYILLWEIRRGDYDFYTPDNSRLLVLVHSIESHNLHNIWTVELQDETGLTIRAWIEPRYVQEQMQQQQETSTIRPGVIWMLSGIGMMVEPNEHEENLERLLLIGGKNIIKVWTPEEAKQNDSRQSQTEFLQWMEQRKAISNGISEMNEDASDASKENDSPPKNPYSRKSRESEQPVINVEEEDDDNDDCDEENDWVNLLQNQRQDNNNLITANAPKSNPSPTSSQHVDEENEKTEQLSQHESTSDIQKASSSQNKRNYQSLRSNDQSHVEETLKKKHQKQHQVKQTPDHQVSERTSPKTRTPLGCQPKSSLWNINDSSIVQGLDDDDDYENISKDELLAKKPEKGGQKQKTPSKKADSSSQSVMEKEATLSRLQSQTPQTSLFAATNFEGLDFSAFDDDE